MMSLLFGNLTKDFVNFATITLASDAGDAAAIAAFPEVAASFRRVAALDATYLVYMGEHLPLVRTRSRLSRTFFSGLGSFVCTYIYMYFWVYTGEVNAKRTREEYLRAVLHQDIAYFDNIGAGEVATRIQSDTRMSSRVSSFERFVKCRADLVQLATSEKVALAVSFLAAFLTGFVLAYARQWRLALAMTSIIPCMGTAGALLQKFLTKYKQ